MQQQEICYHTPYISLTFGTFLLCFMRGIMCYSITFVDNGNAMHSSCISFPANHEASISTRICSSITSRITSRRINRNPILNMASDQLSSAKDTSLMAPDNLRLMAHLFQLLAHPLTDTFLQEHSSTVAVTRDTFSTDAETWCVERGLWIVFEG